MPELDYKSLKAKFLRAYANLPENIRYNDVFIIIDDQPFTWAAAFLEIKEDSITGKKILKGLNELMIL